MVITIYHMARSPAYNLVMFTEHWDIWWHTSYGSLDDILARVAFVTFNKRDKIIVYQWSTKGCARFDNYMFFWGLNLYFVLDLVLGLVLGLWLYLWSDSGFIKPKCDRTQLESGIFKTFYKESQKSEILQFNQNARNNTLQICLSQKSGENNLL